MKNGIPFQQKLARLWKDDKPPCSAFDLNTLGMQFKTTSAIIVLELEEEV